MIIKVNIECLEILNYFAFTINNWDFENFEQYETHAPLKEKETFWQHLKAFM